ncbi:protein-glutamate O-methyltransferase CheR [Rubellimicrobium arenae]|uniref:protein-glutamate O-methyltransferase CheR n=1 Tax=Rubellimicrobium arenae TaxID=2817372 RepID=UPI0034A2AA62
MPPRATADEFQRLCDFLYRRTGLSFTPARRYYVDRRLAARMEATGAATFPDYFARLRADAGGEVEHLVNSLTVNETYFFREDHQLRCLTSSILPGAVARRVPSEPVRIWSVPCSTGEEPYSIAIWLLENWPPIDDVDVEIVGSDIDTLALAAARDGIYGRRSLSRLPPALVTKYFDQSGDESWRIIDGLRESVLFTEANLIDPATVGAQGRFDVIFCRNVLIYFDDMSRRVAAENLYDALVPGGYICLGHAESMSRISPLFEVRRHEEAIVYQRPEGDAHD